MLKHEPEPELSRSRSRPKNNNSPIHPTQRFVPREPATVDGWTGRCSCRQQLRPTNHGAAQAWLAAHASCGSVSISGPRDDQQRPSDLSAAIRRLRDDEGMTDGVTEQRPVTSPVARMLFLAAEVEPLRVELERCEGDLAVAVREASAARAEVQRRRESVLWANARAEDLAVRLVSVRRALLQGGQTADIRCRAALATLGEATS